MFNGGSFIVLYAEFNGGAFYCTMQCLMVVFLL